MDFSYEKRCCSLNSVCASFLILIGVIGGDLNADEVLTETEGLVVIGGTPISGCKNRLPVQPEVKSCNGTNSGGPSGCQTGCTPLSGQGNGTPNPSSENGIAGDLSTIPSSNAPGANSGATSSGSLIDNLTFNYIHYATDYQATGSGPSWSQVQLTRYFRSRDFSQWGSFGPGHFCNYDIKLIATQKFEYESGDESGGSTTNQAKIFHSDPMLFDPTRALTGLFHQIESDFTYFDSGGNVITNPYSGQGSGMGWNLPAESEVEIRLKTGETFRFEVIDLDYRTEAEQEIYYYGFDARLIRIEDRNGYGQSITYKSWTQAEVDASPERQWQIDKVTDDQGEVLSFTYLSQQVGGRWVVDKIDLPNAESIDYSYSNGKLSSVLHSDNTTSTFTYNQVIEDDGTYQYAVADYIDFEDATAPANSRNKRVYLTTSATYDANGKFDHIYNQATQLVRMVVNSNDEVTYFNYGVIDSPGDSVAVYEGSGKLIRLTQWEKVQFYNPGWAFTSQNGSFSLSGTVEAAGIKYGTATSGNKNHPNYIENEQGRKTYYSYTSSKSGMVSLKTYPDDTFEAWCYNSFNQPTRYRDREANVTYYEYDANGNMTKKKVGLKDTWTAPTGGGGSGYGYTGTPNYDPCDTTNDEQTADYAVYEWEYYAASHTHEFLLKTYTDPNGNETDYEYDTNHRLSKVIQPADVAMGTRPETTYTYTTSGRVNVITNPDSSTLTHAYDSRGRLNKITYSDGTTERWFYGTGTDANLLTKKVDRNNVVTKYEYDASGRKTKTIFAYATMNASGTETLITDPAIKVEETYVYLEGTNLIESRTRAGEKTEYTYDYRHRIASTKVYPKSGSSLTSNRTYVNNQLFSSEDPYGRKTFHAYSASTGRLIRSIKTTVPGISYTDFTAVLNETRPSGANPTKLITDYIYDAEGNPTKTIDPKGIEHTTEYDYRQRAIVQVQAAFKNNGQATNASAKTETDYDDANNVVEIRHPRYFDSNDTNGYQKAKTTIAYTGRNLLKSRTEAPGTAEAATESFTYTLDGKRSTHVDFNGETWTTSYPTCCGRVIITKDPLGHGTITQTDPNGNVIHVAHVEDVDTHSTTNNPTDAKTLSEVTTRYDARNRPVARTVWLVARGVVDRDATPPIAGEGGISAADGLTSNWEYDDDLTDSTGLDSTFSSHITGLGLGTNANGSAVLVTNAEGERTLSIKDGQGRNLKTVQLDSSGNALTQVTQAYDTIVNISGYGNVIETSSTNLASHTTKRRTDAAGRTIEAIDAEGYSVRTMYDGNGNIISSKNPNLVGETYFIDDLGRKIKSTSSQNQIIEYEYNSANLLVKITDAKSGVTSQFYNVRGKCVSVINRLGDQTERTFDKMGKLTSIKDSENKIISHEYNEVGLRIKTVFPDHENGSSKGDHNYGITEIEYDANGREYRRIDQLGDTITLMRDLAGRVISREYRTESNSPSGTISDSDSFTYDKMGRLLTAEKGRYNNTVTFSYDDVGRIESETLSIDSSSYDIQVTYDSSGNVGEIIYPSGTEISQNHNPRGQVEQIKRNNSLVCEFTFDSGMRETKRTYGNGLETNRTYVAGGNFVSQIATLGVTSLAYEYDSNNNQNEFTATGTLSTSSWSVDSTTYDAADRLVTWDKSGLGNDVWNYSSEGEISNQIRNQSPISRDYDDSHCVQSMGGITISSNSRGAVTSLRNGYLLDWDSDEFLSQLTKGSATISNEYDALGRRVCRNFSDGIDSEKKIFVYYGNRPLVEITKVPGSQTVEAEYIYGEYIDEPICKHLDNVVNYFHQDRLGSVVAVTDSVGTPLEYYEYSPYGRRIIRDSNGVILSNSSIDNSLGYKAKWTDPSSDIVYNRARYYSPDLESFLSRDPIGTIDGPNVYQYVRSNPTNGVDAFGLACHSISRAPIYFGDGLSFPNGVPSAIFFQFEYFASLGISGEICDVPCWCDETCKKSTFSFDANARVRGIIGLVGIGFRKRVNIARQDLEVFGSVAALRLAISTGASGSVSLSKIVCDDPYGQSECARDDGCSKIEVSLPVEFRASSGLTMWVSWGRWTYDIAAEAYAEWSGGYKCKWRACSDGSASFEGCDFYNDGWSIGVQFCFGGCYNISI